MSWWILQLLCVRWLLKCVHHTKNSLLDEYQLVQHKMTQEKTKRRNEIKAGMSWSLHTPPQLRAGELIVFEEVFEGLLFENSDVFWEIN